MGDHSCQWEPSEEVNDDDTVCAYSHDAWEPDHRAAMFNMRSLGPPYVRLNTPSQHLLPENDNPESVPTVSANDYTQTSWFEDLPPGDHQRAHTYYPSSVELDACPYRDSFDVYHQDSQMPSQSSMLQQTPFSGHGFNLPQACAPDICVQQLEHSSVIPSVSNFSQPNTWLSFRPTQSPGRRSYNHSHHVAPNVYPATGHSQSHATPYLMPQASQNVTSGQYTTLSHLPWSSDNPRFDRSDAGPMHNLDSAEMHEMVSDSSRSRDDASAAFYNDFRDLATTSASSYNEDANAAAAAAERYDRNQTARVDGEDIDGVSGETHALRNVHGSGHIQYNGKYPLLRVREGTPQAEKLDDDDISSAGVSRDPRSNQYLLPHTILVDSSSDASSPSSVDASTTSGIWHCPDPNCEQDFTGKYGKGNLNRHRRLYHPSGGKVAFVCEAPTCARVFRRQDSRLKHYRRHHPRLGAQAPIPRGPQQHNTSSSAPFVPEVPQEGQDSVLRNISSWTGPEFGPD